MRENGIAPNVVSYIALMGKCENINQGKVVANEFKLNFPDAAYRQISTSFICLADSFENALSAAKYLRSERHFVGRGEYDRVFKHPITHYSASELLEIYSAQEFKFDTSLESPINQYRQALKEEDALQLLIAAPHVGAAQKYYREDYTKCKSYFRLEFERGNDEDNLHYAFGVAAALNEDWQFAQKHLNIALQRCFKNASKRRGYIEYLISMCP